MHDFFEKYADRIMPEPNSGCWLWIASATTAGYGNFTRDGKTHYAHRSAYEATHGDGSADGVVVRHQCDNPPCCNPGHLLGGTMQDNTNDMICRGRMNRAVGESASKTKLTEAQVIFARAHATTMTVTEIKRAIGIKIKWSTIDYAIRGKTWRHIGGALPDLPRPMRRVS